MESITIEGYVSAIKPYDDKNDRTRFIISTKGGESKTYYICRLAGNHIERLEEASEARKMVAVTGALSVNHVPSMGRVYLNVLCNSLYVL